MQCIHDFKLKGQSTAVDQVICIVQENFCFFMCATVRYIAVPQRIIVHPLFYLDGFLVLFCFKLIKLNQE